MKRILWRVIPAVVCLMAMTAFADPGDVLMPDPVLEAWVEAIIGDDGISGAVDGNWLVGDGGSSAGPGMNDPDGLMEVGDLGSFDFPMGVEDLTGLEAALNLEVVIFGFGDIVSLTPLKDLPALFGMIFINAGIGDTELAELASGSAAPLVLFLMSVDPDAPANDVTTAGFNSIGTIGSLMELGVTSTGNEVDISGLSGLPLGDIGLGLGLNLAGNTIIGGLDVINEFTGVTSLGLGGTGIGNAGLATIDWSTMTNLVYIDLIQNDISDIAPLTGLIGAASGTEIDLSGNPLDNDAVCTHIPALETAGFTVYHNSPPCGSPVLTLTMTGTGEISPAPGVYRYAAGTDVWLSATNISGGGIFTQWNGNVDSPLTMGTNIQMNSDETVEAVFEDGDWTLTMSHVGAGSGTTNPPPGVWPYRDGDTPWISYTVAGGSYWGGWQGDLSGIFHTSLNMDGDKVVTAVFGDTGYDLTIAVDGSGNTNPATGTYSLADGTVVDINAFVTDPTYFFHHWTGDIGAADPNSSDLQVTVDQPRTVTAVFQRPVLTISVTGDGYTDPAAGEHTYNANEWVGIAAFANPGSQFSHWEGDLSGSNPNTGITMNGDKSVTAVFTATAQYELEINIVGNGQTNPAAGTHTYADGTAVNVNAIADEGWYFDRWEGDASGTASSTVVTMDANKSITAVFSQYDWSLTMQVTGNGTLDPPAGVYYYNTGQSHLARALPGAGSGFDRWEGDTDGAGIDNNLRLINIPMDRNRVVTAVFVEINWNLTMILDGVGAPSPGPGTHVYPDGTVVWLFGGWAPGQQAVTAFDNWSGAINSIAQYTSIVMDADKTVTAHYADADWTLTVEHGGAGSGSTFPTPGVYGFLDGRRTGIPVTSIAAGSYFGGWEGDASGYDLTYVITMDGNKTVRAMFETSGYLLTINPPVGQGTVNPTPAVRPYATGATPTITATATGLDWVFDRWEGDLGGADPSNPVLTVTMDQDRAVTAIFAEGAGCENPTTGGMFEVGQSICFRVPEPVAPGSSYQWSRNGVPLADGHVLGATGRSLYINNLQVSDTGAYTCAYDDGAKAPALYGPVSITVAESVPLTGFGGLALLAVLCALGGAILLPRSRRIA